MLVLPKDIRASCRRLLQFQRVASDGARLRDFRVMGAPRAFVRGSLVLAMKSFVAVLAVPRLRGLFRPAAQRRNSKRDTMRFAAGAAQMGCPQAGRRVWNSVSS
jgi:hypothetical protein